MKLKRHHLTAFFVSVALAGTYAGMAAEEPDCTKPSSTNDHAFCADKQYEESRRRLDVIDKEIARRLIEDEIPSQPSDLSGERTGRATLYAQAVKAWRDYASAKCRAFHEGRGGGQWPDVHLANCMRHLAEDRIRDLCSDPPESDYAGGACSTIDLRSRDR